MLTIYNKCLRCLKSIQPTETHYGFHPACFKQSFKTDVLEEFTELNRRDVSVDPEAEDETISSFFHGKFKKYSAVLGEASYILKMREVHVPELPTVEDLSNRIGAALGIPVAEFQLIVYHGEPVFVTKNFVDKRRNQTLNHIYHYQPDRKPRNCETLVSILWDETKSYADVETFVRMCLFDALIGNNDRHGRNLGILVTSIGSRLAPIYDNPSILGVESGPILKAQFNPTCRIPTATSESPSISDYVHEFKRLGHEEAVEQWGQRLNLDLLLRIVDDGFCSDEMKNALKDLLSRRTKEFFDAVP